MSKPELDSSWLEPSLPLGKEREWRTPLYAFMISAWVSFKPHRDQSASFSWLGFLKNDFWVFKRKLSADLDFNRSLKTWGIALLTFFSFYWPSSNPYAPGSWGQSPGTSRTSALWGRFFYPGVPPELLTRKSSVELGRQKLASAQKRAHGYPPFSGWLRGPPAGGLQGCRLKVCEQFHTCAITRLQDGEGDPQYK